ncbi:MAG TPA: TonB-dependent receptor [Bacteroidetes bacterium]|nr:TonB-dependent receptor [Bacteroidota bacterium]
MRIKLLLPVILLSLIFPSLLFPGTTGKIAGMVRDKQTSDPLPGANVILEGTTMAAAAGIDGSYIILNVPPGVYTVKAMMMGYQSVRMENIIVSIDQTSSVEFVLDAAVLDIGQEVTIVAERPIVKSDMTSSLSSVTAEDIQNLPVQEISDVLELQAGLVKDAVGGLHVRGGRSGEVAYWINGVAATDVYSGAIGVEVDNSSVQEMQVVSGTFNAEYGQAMSGIVNIVTKEGGSRFKGSIGTYFGDYVSSKKDVFFNIDKINLTAIRNFQGNISGPVPGTKGKLTFFSMARYFYNDGWLYGREYFKPQGIPGDSSIVPMNFNRRYFLQNKFTYKFTPSFKISYELFLNRRAFKYFNHYFKFNPYGDYQRFEKGQTHLFTVDHILSPKTFYTVRVSNFYNQYKHYIYKDPLLTPTYMRSTADSTKYLIDPNHSDGYVHPDSLNAPASFSFADGGTSMNHFKRSTGYWIGKFDINSQVTKAHQVKAGVEIRRHKLTYDSFDLQAFRVGNEEIRPFRPFIPDPSTPNHDIYTEKPYEFSGYLQDKIELKSIIVNIGLRFDLFNSKGKILTDPTDPDIYFPAKPEHEYKNWDPDLPADRLIEYSLAEREVFWYKNPSTKTQVSPRLGIAYPITDRGVIHFSYGHFFQIPLFEYLFASPGYKVTQSSGSKVVGNPDLNAQQTVQYEVGLQQQISDNTGFDVTLFYRDVRDWVGAGPPVQVAIPGVWYSQYENKEYSNVRGITLSVDKRYSSYFSASLDYSFMIADGTYSSPNDAFFAIAGNQEPRLSLIPMAWDQRHTLNGTIAFGVRDWRISMIGRYYSGSPYTPRFGKGQIVGAAASSGLEENSSRKPTIFSFDLYVYKKFKLSKLHYSVFAKIYNLFDRDNPTNVWTDTGLVNFTLDRLGVTEDPVRVGTVRENFLHPEWYSQPRRIQTGISIEF